MNRFLRRVPAARWARLQYVRRERRKQRERAWEHTQAVLIALGNITIAWAGINLILNRFIEAYHTQVGPVIGKDLPRSFTKKLEFLEKIETKIPWHPSRLAELTDFRLRLAKLNEMRVKLVHGLLMRRGYTPTWTVHIAKEVGPKLMRRDDQHDAADIHRFSKDVSEIGRELARFFAPIFGIRTDFH